ncbi:hypothetical protein [Vibrio phage vB_VmeM-Yong XC32]|nr:hypothetical protein [Vibrio phage vB_VmeM-Yong XC31]QAX96372.1 hypothetical protein [Vibrio phage vB_VmeM-Yong XC32]QAX96690.1 hypothetical protein [Vibrio phage vB_VmeM-Yong MS31]QAX97008.1 hypothetical protein [Vibrio phage vB_VmeM-Yong MS32]
MKHLFNVPPLKYRSIRRTALTTRVTEKEMELWEMHLNMLKWDVQTNNPLWAKISGDMIGLNTTLLLITASRMRDGILPTEVTYEYPDY